MVYIKEAKETDAVIRSNGIQRPKFICAAHDCKEYTKVCSNNIFIRWAQKQVAHAYDTRFLYCLMIKSIFDEKTMKEFAGIVFRFYETTYKPYSKVVPEIVLDYSAAYHICNFVSYQSSGPLHIEKQNKFPAYMFMPDIINDNSEEFPCGAETLASQSRYLSMIKEKITEDYRDTHHREPSHLELQIEFDEIINSSMDNRDIQLAHIAFITNGDINFSLEQAIKMDCPLFNIYTANGFDIQAVLQYGYENKKQDIIDWTISCKAEPYIGKELMHTLQYGRNVKYCMKIFAEFITEEFLDNDLHCEMVFAGYLSAVKSRRYCIAELLHAYIILAGKESEPLQITLEHYMANFIPNLAKDQLYFYIKDNYPYKGKTEIYANYCSSTMITFNNILFSMIDWQYIMFFDFIRKYESWGYEHYMFRTIEFLYMRDCPLMIDKLIQYDPNQQGSFLYHINGLNTKPACV